MVRLKPGSTRKPPRRRLRFGPRVCSGRVRVASLMPLLTIDLVKAAAVVEMRGLGFLPAAEGIVDGDQLEGWKLAGVLARDVRIAWAVEIARDDVLALLGV